jgi:hypothetical protein
MKENSRIRFNPVTKEIEVEGSEKFVRTYFQKLQELLSQGPGDKAKRGPKQKVRSVKKAKRAKAAPGRKKAAKGTQADTVVALVNGSDGGITTSALMEKTGLTERQIWGIVYRAQKQGKIKKTKRGMYTAA